MKHVISLFIILFICPFVNGQIKSDKLQKEQKILEKKITQTKALLNKVQNNAKNSFTEIKS